MQSAKQLLTKVAMSLAAKTKKTGRPFTVIVEGNVGSGKTTFLEHFSKYPDVCVLAEPVENWRDLNGHNLLGLMYQDPKRWGFTFQSYVQLTMLQNHLKTTARPIKMIERSIYSARYCFVEKMTRDGALPLASSAVIDRWFQWILHQNLVDVDLVVYLRTSPEVVYERILRRQRPEEKPITLEFIQSLHNIHEDWLFYKVLFQCPAPVLVLNANLERASIHSEYEKSKMHILSKAQQAAAHAL